MPKFHYFVVARGISVDHRRGPSITIFSILDVLPTVNFPIILPTISIAGMAKKEDGDKEDNPCTLSIRLNGDELIRENFSIEYSGNSDRFQMAVELNGLFIPGPGDLIFEITSNNTVLATSEIAVVGPHIKLDTKKMAKPKFTLPTKKKKSKKKQR